eukprot:2105916-Rhodomonas_salina.2
MDVWYKYTVPFFLWTSGTNRGKLAIGLGDVHVCAYAPATPCPVLSYCIALCAGMEYDAYAATEAQRKVQVPSPSCIARAAICLPA